MTIVHCNETTCEYCAKQGETDFLCTKDRIDYSDWACGTYLAHTDASPEYQEMFWKHMKSRKDGHHCRKEGRGKRYEIGGYTWFTEEDDRWGTDDLWFTEQRSGLRSRGRDIESHLGKQIQEAVENTEPVLNLPEADLEDL